MDKKFTKEMVDDYADKLLIGLCLIYGVIMLALLVL